MIFSYLPIPLLETIKAFLLVLSLLFALSDADAASGRVVIIVNQNKSVEEQSLSTLKNIYVGNVKAWSGNGKTFVILPPPGSAEMQALLTKVLGLQEEDDLSRMYLKLIFQQKITKIPLTAQTIEAAVTNVASTEGALAIVDEASLAPDAKVRRLIVPGL